MAQQGGLNHGHDSLSSTATPRGAPSPSRKISQSCEHVDTVVSTLTIHQVTSVSGKCGSSLPLPHLNFPLAGYNGSLHQPHAPSQRCHRLYPRVHQTVPYHCLSSQGEVRVQDLDTPPPPPPPPPRSHNLLHCLWAAFSCELLNA